MTLTLHKQADSLSEAQKKKNIVNNES